MFTQPRFTQVSCRSQHHQGALLPPLRVIICALLAATLSACSEPPSGLHLRDAYIKTAIPGRTMTAAYATLTNHEPQPLCLIGFAADFASRIELHETRQTENRDRVSMHRLPRLCIEPGSSATLAPGGKHLMVMGLGSLPAHNARIVLGTASGRAFEGVFAVRPFNQ